MVEFVVSLAPVQVIPRQVEVHCRGASHGGGHTEGTSVGERIQEDFVQGETAKLAAVKALIEEKPRRISRPKINLEIQPGLESAKRFANHFAGQVFRDSFVFFEERSPVDRAISQNGIESWFDVVRRLDDPATGKIIDDQTVQAIAGAVHQADGVCLFGTDCVVAAQPQRQSFQSES